MNMLNLMYELSPAQVVAAALMLPWMVVALMHLVSAGADAGLDDNFSSRGEAALRWAHRAPDPVTPLASAVAPYRARCAAQLNTGTHGKASYLEHEAA
jgi:hypothetical protein